MAFTRENIEKKQERYEQCITDLARWFIEHRKKMTVKVMRPIIEKHFTAAEEYTEFYKYLSSPEGREQFRKVLRLEAWKAGLAGPPA